MQCPADESLKNTDRCWARWLLFAFGWLNVGVGVIGIFVPGLPITVFLIIALWAFSKSSDRFHSWLWNHPRLGPSIQNWHVHRVIPVKAKVLAVTMMTTSFLFLTFYVAESWVLPALMVVLMVPPGIYVVTRKSELQPVPVSD
ncbi:MAG: YbaN family protein [Rhodospirillales bacterium]|nr:YbaN family protein [Rhodospirillales bacterium]